MLINTEKLEDKILLEHLYNDAIVFFNKGDLVKAQELTDKLLLKNGNDLNALNLLGAIYYSRKEYKITESLLLKVLSINPNSYDANNNLSIIYMLEGRLEEAIKHSQEAVRIKPTAEVYNNLGTIYEKLGNLNAALEYYKKAIIINPNFSNAYNNLGSAFKKLNKLDDSLFYLEQSVLLNQHNILAINNLISLYLLLGKQEQAYAFCNKILQLDPCNCDALVSLSVVLKRKGELDEAIKLCEEALSVNPNYKRAHFQCGSLLMVAGEVDKAIIHLREAMNDSNDDNVVSNLLLCLQYSNASSNEEAFRLAKEWGNKFSNIPHYCRKNINKIQDKKLKIGYVSADFRNHPVGFFLEPVLKNHNKKEFEVFCYANQFNDDDLTERLKQFVPNWRYINNLSDEEVVNHITNDKIDILIDLSGHTASNRLKIFAYKPAPIQISWLGYFATTGLKAMDYIISDPYLIPVEEEKFYVEKVLRIPDTWFSFAVPNFEVPLVQTPALDSNVITLGCFNNITKINEDVVRTWASIMQAIPNTVLILKSQAFLNTSIYESYKEVFVKYGIDKNRIILEGSST
jgi:predicted O-linked N-acetylglucosamine transferase (SPINDLY family)